MGQLRERWAGILLTVAGCQGAPPVATDSFCPAAVERLHAACPRAEVSIGDCRSNKYGRRPLDDLVLAELGSGRFVHFGAEGPEWFLGDDGSILTNNAAAAELCERLATVEDEAARVLLPAFELPPVPDIGLDHERTPISPTRNGSAGRASTCCKYCKKGKPCGDTCIARSKTCNAGRGCAC